MLSLWILKQAADTLKSTFEKADFAKYDGWRPHDSGRLRALINQHTTKDEEASVVVSQIYSGSGLQWREQYINERSPNAKPTLMFGV